MRYDFDTPVNRRNTNSMKWAVGEQELPMWVADMDFATAPAVREAIEKRAAHGVFGYARSYRFSFQWGLSPGAG